MKLFKAVLSVAVTLALIWVLEIKIGPVPPVAPFINPATGFWQNAESRNFDATKALTITGLKDEVIIKYDEHMVPHIFASNDHDLYFAQGYVTAKDRLWEMDIQTRQASGRLAEVLGPGLLEVDRYHRRTGMLYGAEQSIAEMMKDPRLKVAVQAYTDGVNNYIHQLWKRDYPIEFKLLDYEPEDFKPINCALLLKLMTETLAGHTDAAAMTAVLRKFGAATTNNLFPDYPYRETPIIPAGTPWNFKPLAIPQPSAAFKAQMQGTVSNKEQPEGIGSNNWAVAGSKTASGYPILANDPHLNLTFPSIWYQVQLNAPGVNVRGVSLPGSPFVIIGYNDKISWGVTNVDADVLDFYNIRFKDATRNQYFYNNKWNTTTKRVETIMVRGEKTVIDTVVYTHHGPVVYNDAKSRPDDNADIPVGSAMRWVAHLPSKDVLCFYLLNRAKTFDDYRAALNEFSAPAQNFAFASVDKDIAMTVNGKLPLKYKDQGKFILDGTDPADDWQGWLPFEHNPAVKNPPRGFVSSANQSSVDQTYPYYINWSFGAYERGKRINDRLAAMTNITVDSIRKLQTDNYSILAHDVLPTMLNYVNAAKLNKEQTAALSLLKNWNKRFDAGEKAASVFDAWWSRFYNLTWADDFKDASGEMKMPSRDRLVKLLLTEPNSRWFDDACTPQKETCTDMVNRAFVASVDTLIKKYGVPGDKWAWGKVKDTHINHLARLAGFGTGRFEAGGTGSTVNALSGGHGPSWRMVVQMGPQVKGYGVYPGGQSGNPGSFYYDDMLETWKRGELTELLFLRSISEQSPRIKSTLTLKAN